MPDTFFDCSFDLHPVCTTCCFDIPEFFEMPVLLDNHDSERFSDRFREANSAFALGRGNDRAKAPFLYQFLKIWLASGRKFCAVSQLRVMSFYAPALRSPALITVCTHGLSRILGVLSWLMMAAAF